MKFIEKGLYILFLLLFVFSSCKKGSNSDDCTIPISSNNQGYALNIVSGSFNGEWLFVNQSNSDEIGYYTGSNIGYGGANDTVPGRLWIYNTQSLTKQVLVTGYQYVQPNWGTNGWIIFNSNSFIKSNGDSLKVLNFITGYSVVWSPDCKQIAFLGGHEPDIYRTICIINIDGTGLRILDSVIGMDGYFAWSPDGAKIAYGVGTGNPTLSIIDINTLQVQNYPNVITPAYWFPDSKRLLYTAGGALLIFNTETSQITTIRPVCQKEIYYSGLISSDGNTVIAEKNITTISGNSENVSTRLVKMNADGSDETDITPPN